MSLGATIAFEAKKFKEWETAMVGRHEWPETGIEGFERGYATVDGVRLHYVSGGRADGEVILLFAGFPQSWYAWRKILPILGARYRIIAPDLPGQGDSDRPISGCDTMNMRRSPAGLSRNWVSTDTSLSPTISAPGSRIPTQRFTEAAFEGWRFWIRESLE